METYKISFGGNPVTLIGTHLHVGDQAPVFSVLDSNLQSVSSETWKNKILILSVFPSVDTPVCALQKQTNPLIPETFSVAYEKRRYTCTPCAVWVWSLWTALTVQRAIGPSTPELCA